MRRSWQPGGSHDLTFSHGPVDADTLRWREMQDRKGELAFTIRTHSGDVFDVRHSTLHTRRYDIFQRGRKLGIARLERVLHEIARCTPSP